MQLKLKNYGAPSLLSLNEGLVLKNVVENLGHLLASLGTAVREFLKLFRPMAQAFHDGAQEYPSDAIPHWWEDPHHELNMPVEERMNLARAHYIKTCIPNDNVCQAQTTVFPYNTILPKFYRNTAICYDRKSCVCWSCYCWSVIHSLRVS